MDADDTISIAGSVESRGSTRSRTRRDAVASKSSSSLLDESGK